METGWELPNTYCPLTTSYGLGVASPLPNSSLGLGMEGWSIPPPPNLPSVHDVRSSHDVTLVELGHGEAGMIGQYAHPFAHSQCLVQPTVLLTHGDEPHVRVEHSSVVVLVDLTHGPRVW